MEGFHVARKQRSGLLVAVLVVLEELARRSALPAVLRLPLGQFIGQPPAALADVALGVVAAIDLTAEVDMGKRKASANSAPLPTLGEDLLDLPRHQLGIEEQQGMEVRVPAVELAISDLEGADVTPEADPGAELLAALALIELGPGGMHAHEQVRQVIAEAVRNRESHEIDRQAQGLGALDRLFHLLRTALADLRGADRTGPGRGAHLEAVEVGTLEGRTLQDLDVHVRQTPGTALAGFVALGQQATGNPSQGVALGAALAVPLELLLTGSADLPEGDFPGLGIQRLDVVCRGG